MLLSRMLSRSQSQENLVVRRHTPWIASPLETDEPPSRISTSQNSTHELKEANEHSHGIKFELPAHTDHELPPFKHHRESSTIELFYDLFFVANLSSFTSNHEITNTESLKNYIGFFTILWFTWLQTSLFDVRFATDSVWNRFAKAISFGVMTGFAITGAIYDTSDVVENVKAFRALSMILMVSRLCLVAQYAVILFYVRRYSKTWAPLLWTMGALFVAAMIYLGTFFGFDTKDAGESFPIQHGGPQTYIAYYVVACIETVAIIAISCIWRVVSFKHTHLVERIGLLTLIIMGEGIIGITKSVSQILRNSSSTSGSDIATIVSSVLLIYFIWVLYFDQIENDRFGTIRQQIWALLHFPLHVAILLTVEGTTELILWNIIVHADDWWWYWYPVYTVNEFSTWYNSTEEVIQYVNETVTLFSERFKEGALQSAYDYNVNLTSIRNINATFGTPKWNNDANNICADMWTGIENFIFQNFGIEIDEETKSSSQAAAARNANNAYYNLYDTVFIYFFVAAGFFLIILAVLYWFGKNHKSRSEWMSIVVRTVAGIGITLAALSVYYGPYNSSTDFLRSPWLIPVVMLGFFVVIVLDNFLVWHGNRTVSHLTSTARGNSVFEHENGDHHQPERESDEQHIRARTNTDASHDSAV